MITGCRPQVNGLLALALRAKAPARPTCPHAARPSPPVLSDKFAPMRCATRPVERQHRRTHAGIAGVEGAPPVKWRRHVLSAAPMLRVQVQIQSYTMFQCTRKRGRDVSCWPIGLATAAAGHGCLLGASDELARTVKEFQSANNLFSFARADRIADRRHGNASAGSARIDPGAAAPRTVEGLATDRRA